MAFRTIEITKPAELHMKNGQLEISQEDGVVLGKMIGRKWSIVQQSTKI